MFGWKLLVITLIVTIVVCNASAKNVTKNTKKVNNKDKKILESKSSKITVKPKQKKLPVKVTKSPKPIKNNLNKNSTKHKNKQIGNNLKLSKQKPNHPQLLFDRNHLKALRNGWNKTSPFIKQQIMRVVERDIKFPLTDLNETFITKHGFILGSNLPLYTIYCEIHQNKTCKENLLEMMDFVVKLKTWKDERFMSDKTLSTMISGFTISIDIIMDSLPSWRISKYTKKLELEAQRLYADSRSLWWGSNPLHEISVNNHMALFLVGLFGKIQKNNNSSLWIVSGGRFLDRVLHIANGVTDGSLPISLLDSQKASLPLMIYIHLTERHYQIPAAAQSWIYSHLVFTLHEILPLFSIPDSVVDQHPRWCYGPEAQLAFLDRFAAADGRASWILNKILVNNAYKDIISVRKSWKVTPSLFYYLIWKADGIKPTRPRLTAGLFHLPDSGLLRYRDTNWDLFLRASRPYGPTVQDALEKSTLDFSYTNLTSLDEPPYQGGFNLIIRGIPVFTAFQGSVFTDLQNSISFLVRNSDENGCLKPWFGQLGECSERRSLFSKSDVIAATRTIKELTLLAVDIADAYPSFLKLNSVQRRVLVLGSEMLIIVDHIHAHSDTPIRLMSSSFANMYFSWEEGKSLPGFPVNFLNTPDGKIQVQVTSLSSTSKRVKTEIVNTTVIEKSGGKIDVSLLNVTFALDDSLSTIVYIIGAPNVQVISNRMGSLEYEVIMRYADRNICEINDLKTNDTVSFEAFKSVKKRKIMDLKRIGARSSPFFKRVRNAKEFGKKFRKYSPLTKDFESDGFADIDHIVEKDLIKKATPTKPSTTPITTTVPGTTTQFTDWNMKGLNSIERDIFLRIHSRKIASNEEVKQQRHEVNYNKLPNLSTHPTVAFTVIVILSFILAIIIFKIFIFSKMKLVIIGLAVFLAGSFARIEPNEEFRAVWVATVNNLDWPSSKTLRVPQQILELQRIIDYVKESRMNAIIFQIRPAGDALYNSSIEPWSVYMTNSQGTPPSPFYDPLSFLIAKAHEQNIEVHAWVNPYRANLRPDWTGLAPNHMANEFRQYAYPYGNYLWMDPGAKPVQDRLSKVIRDVLDRYDVDGIHWDDYFYPYPVNSVSFPDDKTYNDYLSAGGALPRDDWRRKNVNDLVQRVYNEIKALKRHVKFSISPFGIYRPGHPEGMPRPIAGFDQYTQLYADAKLWLQNGWVDFLSPQLYWEIDPPAQSYTTLLNWWCNVNQQSKNRHIYAGNAVYKIENNDWPANEIKRQIEVSRSLTELNSLGNVHFRVKLLMNNIKGIADLLKNHVYTKVAAIPPMPWLANSTFIETAKGVRTGGCLIIWNKPTQPVHKWGLFKWRDNEWSLTNILSGKLIHAEVREPGRYAVAAYNEGWVKSILSDQVEVTEFQLNEFDPYFAAGCDQ
ncbi:DgyrCDS2933 [Dimorphilus gyrociliatus]|uniref:DgyrCDS2933 n=1 Tax=Dimorphilus gyrociliatus TaxID=2664684 RepID=A0A7I8VDH1_9ANNE|nr:DgyrCDS2933 [Dimorphilus gyrociliatus]